jgi:hypothetical protein
VPECPGRHRTRISSSDPNPHRPNARSYEPNHLDRANGRAPAIPATRYSTVADQIGAELDRRSDSRIRRRGKNGRRARQKSTDHACRSAPTAVSIREASMLLGLTFGAYGKTIRQIARNLETCGGYFFPLASPERRTVSVGEGRGEGSSARGCNSQTRSQFRLTTVNSAKEGESRRPVEGAHRLPPGLHHSFCRFGQR